MIRLGAEAGQLARRHRLTAFAGGLLLVVLFAVLIWREYDANLTRELDLRERSVRERLAVVEAIVRAADVHVDAMKAGFLASYLAPVAPQALYALAFTGEETSPLVGTARPDDRDAFRTGLVIGSRSRLLARAPDDGEITALAGLFPQMAASHKVQRFFRWSYYFSATRDFVAVWPWAPAEEMLGPPEGQEATLASYFDYDVFKLTTIEHNPQRLPIWTAVYFDAGGAGLMVSHNVPVDVDGRQIGMIGTDVTLDVFSDALATAGDKAGLYVLSDQAGNVVADSRGRAKTADAILAATSLMTLPPKTEAPPGRFVRFGADYHADLAVAGAPWTLHYAVPAAEVRLVAIEQVAPYLTFLVAFVCVLLLTYLAIARSFVRPAIHLAGLVEGLAEGEDVKGSLSSFPGPWRTWAERIVDAYDRLTVSNRRLAAAERKTRAVIEVALDAVITVDAACRVIDFNPAAEKIFGYTAAQARGRPVGDLIVPGEMRRAHEEGLERFQRTRQAHVLGRRIEVEALTADGGLIPIELQIHALDAVEGVHFAAYVRDLTEARRSAAEIAAQRERLHQAEKLSAMGSLLASLAHELNNPLAIVVAQATLMDELPDDPRNRDRIGKVRAAAERCGRIVKTFLTMVRQQAPTRSAAPLGTIVDSALEIAAYGVRSAGVEILRSGAEHLPDVEVDQDQITQVVINLVLNAQQALRERSGDRRIWIETGRWEDGVFLAVSDNGPGVPEAIRERIFEAFFTTKPLGVGTGIGLAVCRNIVEAHGGTITVEDRPGGGARFRIVLPIGSGTAGAEATRQASQRARDALAVLVVDDEVDVGETLAALLESDGHAVTVVSTIAEAVRLAGSRRFDVVFSDLHMPDGGGLALQVRLSRQHPALARRFIFVTGDMVAGPASIEKISGGSIVVAKPFGRDDIRQALETLPATAR